MRVAQGKDVVWFLDGAVASYNPTPIPNPTGGRALKVLVAMSPGVNPVAAARLLRALADDLDGR